jgi:peptidoglycan/xylan/chitin deacetylase (PgdA/CDA1 family)
MKAAMTLDDLPCWQEAPYPRGHSAHSVARALAQGFRRHGIDGVFAFANSKPFTDDASLRPVMDDWCAAGHHVANHTHSHPILHQTSAEAYMADIDRADRLLAPWMDAAPSRYFRYTWNIRGETEEKRAVVRAHLDDLGYRPAEVSAWFYEWDWDAAYLKCLERNDATGIAFLKETFVAFARDQLLHDDAGMRRVFGRQVPHIMLLHNVSFIELVLDDLLEALKALGVTFVPLEEAMADEAYAETADFPCGEFLNYWRKQLWRGGAESDETAPSQTDVYRRVLAMAGDR